MFPFQFVMLYAMSPLFITAAQRLKLVPNSPSQENEPYCRLYCCAGLVCLFLYCINVIIS